MIDAKISAADSHLNFLDENNPKITRKQSKK
jgi:hypothetical protein